MVARRDLTASPARREADRLKGITRAARQWTTAPHGIQDLGVRGDTTWIDSDGKNRSVKDTASQADQLAVNLAEANTILAQAQTDLLAAQAQIDQAKVDVAQALKDAAAAQDAADGAQATADGKNTITRSASEPVSSTPGKTAGDTWWQHDDSGQIIGQWTWNGSSWQPSLLSSEVIASLTVDKLAAANGTINKLVAQQIAAATAAFQTVLVDHLVASDASLGKAVAQQIAAATATFQQVAVENITATGTAAVDTVVAQRIATKIIEAGVFKTGVTSEGIYAIMDAAGFRVERQSVDGTQTVVSLGPSGDLLLDLGKSRIDGLGVGSFQQINANEIWLNGKNLLDVLASRPRVVGTVHRVNNTLWRNQITRLEELWMTLEPDHYYRLTRNPAVVEIDRAGQDWADMALELRAITGHFTDSNPWWGDPSWIKARSQTHIQGNQSPVGTVPGIDHFIDTSIHGNWYITGRQVFDFLVSLRDTSPDGGARFRTWGNWDTQNSLVVEDLGPVVYNYGTAWQDAETARPSQPAPPPPPPPPPQRVTRQVTLWANDLRTYYLDSGQQNSGFGGKVAQGSWDYTSSNRQQGLWVFPAMPSELGGATINWVTLSANCLHTYNSSGMTAGFALHGYSGIPYSGPQQHWIGQISGWTANSRRDFAVPGQYFDGFRNGTWRGFGMSVSETDPEHYGYFDAGASITINYTV